MTLLKKIAIFSGLIVASVINMSAAGSNNEEKIEWRAPEARKAGVSRALRNGSFFGMAGDVMIQAGGYNQDGTVSNVVMAIGRENVVEVKLPIGITDGIALSVPEGLICIGGYDGERWLADIFLITLDGSKPDVRRLPSLPVPLEAPAATLFGNNLLVAGGRIGDDSGVYSRSLFLLDLSSLQQGWSEESECMEAPRTGAMAAVQNNGVNQTLYIIGGYDAKGIPGGIAAYDLTLKKWKHFYCGLPENIIGAVPVAANHIFLATDNTENTAGKPTLWKYHTVTNTLVKEADLPIDNNLVSMTRTADGFSLLAADPAGVDMMLLEGLLRTSDKGLGVINTLVIILYFVMLAGIGIYFSRRQKNTDDYFKGGGRIPWWAAGLSLFGTALSAITFMAIPAKAYATDWSYALFNMGIVFVAPIIVWVFIPYFRKLNITTAYQYLEIRFNALIRVICSVAFIIFQVGRMGVVLYLPAIALNVVTGIDIFMCIGIMGICSILYTMIGGIEAVVWTDAIQVIILLGGALFAVIYIAFAIPGGFHEAISIAAAANKFDLGSVSFDLKDATMWTVVIAACFTNLTTYGTDQSMVQRYLTTPSLQGARKSVWTNALLTIPATILFFFIGTSLYSYYSVFPENLSVTIPNGDAIFPWYIFTELPAGVVGLLISGIFAAAMSTLSGSMNSAATAYIVDIYPRIHRMKKPGLHAARTATLVIGAISLSFAILMATWNVSSLWDEFQKILGLILGSMGGLFMLGMLTKRANSGGALIGIAVSMAVQFFVARFHTFHLLLYTTSGFITCFAVGYLASFLFTEKTSTSFATSPEG